VPHITGFRLFRCDLPLLFPLHHASTSTDVLEEVVLELLCSDGTTGIAETRGNASYATGSDTGQVLNEALDLGGPLIGTRLERASDRLEETSASPLVSALIDVAIADASARFAQEPLWSWLGGRRGEERLDTHIQIGFWPIQDCLATVAQGLALGFRRVKLRVGRPDPAEDVELIHAVRRAGGDELEIAVDANGSWDVPTAIGVLSSTVNIGLSWVEQPTDPSDLDALKAVRAGVSLPVVADEAVRNAVDLTRVAALGAADGVHVKLEKAGTISKLRATAAQALSMGIDVYVGQMDQGRLGCAATAHVASTISARAYELWGFQNVVNDFSRGLEVQDGSVALSDSPGLGLNVDLTRLELVKELA
jgi:L-alanine-DL-glutamate epimerase-like enolase superfamily enzyme